MQSIVLAVQNEHGEQLEYQIGIPESAHEVTLSAWDAFTHAIRTGDVKYRAALGQLSQHELADFSARPDIAPPAPAFWTVDDFVGYTHYLVDALVEIVQCDDTAILYALPCDTIEQRASLRGMVLFALSKIGAYKPTPIAQFEHEGHIYFLPPNATDTHGNIIRYAQNITMLEATDALALEQLAANSGAAFGFKQGQYAGDLAVMAAICRRATKQTIRGKKGTKPQVVLIPEPIPASPNAWQDLISQRIEALRNVPLSTAFDVAFFLTISNADSENILKLNLRSMLSRLHHLLKKMQQAVSDKKRPPRIGKRSGGMMLY